MNHLRNCFFQTILAIGLVIVFALGSAWAGSKGKTDTLSVGYMTVPNTVLMVKKLGWLEKALKRPVKWVKFESGRHVLQAFEAEEIDLAHIGTTPCAKGISNGLPIEVVWIHEVIGDSEALVVRENAGIQELKDLEGKTIAIPFGSTTHYHLKVALKLANVKDQKLRIVDLDPEQMFAAWLNGKIDGGFVWEPTVSKMADQGGKILLTSKALADRGFPTADVCAARKRFSSENPSTLSQFIKTMDKAIRLYRSDPNRVIKIVADELNTSFDKATKQMQGLIFLTAEEQALGKYVGEFQWNFGLYTLLKNTADFLEKEKEIESAAPWPVFMRAVNPKYLKEALAK